MNSFLLSNASQQETATLNNKIHETTEMINLLKASKFLLSFARTLKVSSMTGFSPVPRTSRP